VKGVIIYPSSVEELLAKVERASSEYQIMIDHLSGRDILTLFFETAVQTEEEKRSVAREVRDLFKQKIGIMPHVKAVDIGELPRSEKKTTRVFDNRY